MALRLVLETLQAEPQPLSGLWHLLGGSRHHLRPSGTGSQSAATAAAMGQWRYEYMESMVESMASSATAETQVAKEESKSRSQRQRQGERQGQHVVQYDRASVWPSSPRDPTSGTALAADTFDCEHCGWRSSSSSPSINKRCSAQRLFERDEKDPGYACRCTCYHAEVCQEAALRYHQDHASVGDGPQRSSGGLGSSPSCSTSPAWILENVSWRSLGNVASIYRGVQTAGGCPFGTNRRSSAEPPLCQGGLRGMPQRSHRFVQERPAADRKCRSGDVYRACGRSHSCPASTRLGLDAWPSDQFEKQCRSHGRRLQQLCQETPPERAHRSHRRGGRWGSLIAWAIGAFWHGPQVTSALPSSCAGLVASEVSHAAILAWTHSIWEEPTFTTVWQASFRALCLSFDLGTLQPSHRHAVERHTSRPALGSSRQVKFNPIVSVALSPDVDWTLHSFDISEASLSTWIDKPWSGKRISKPRSHRNADDRHFPLRHLPVDGQAHDAQQDQPPPPIGPFSHEAPQSIQDLFQAFIAEDLIEGEELLEPVRLRSWYVHHRRVPEWNTPRVQELQGHWRFWAADILAGWDDQLYQDEDVALALVFPNPPRTNDVMRPVLFDLLVIQGLDLPRRACLATVIRFQDPQQRAERSLAVSLPYLVSAKYVAARAHLVQDCRLNDCAVRHGRTQLPWNDVPTHDARDGQSFIIRRLPGAAAASSSAMPAISTDVSGARPTADDNDEQRQDTNDNDLDYDSNVSMASTVDRQSVFVYRLAAPTTFGHADWSTHHAMIASLARIAEIPLDQVVTAHHLQCQLPDQPPNVLAVILQHVHDIRPASVECLVIIDLELHSHHQPGVPPVAPHSTRQVHRVYPLLRRANILQLAHVDAYCEWVRHSCLVYHNGRG